MNRGTSGDEGEAPISEASNACSMESDAINARLDEQAPETVVHGADLTENMKGREPEGADVEENDDDDEIIFIGDVDVDQVDVIEKEVEDVCIQPEFIASPVDSLADGMNAAVHKSEEDVPSSTVMMTGPGDSIRNGVAAIFSNLLDEPETKRSDARKVSESVQHDEKHDTLEPVILGGTNVRDSLDEDTSRDNELAATLINHETVQTTNVTDDSPGSMEVHENVAHIRDDEASSNKRDVDTGVYPLILDEVDDDDDEKPVMHTFTQDVPNGGTHPDSSGISSLIPECSTDVTRLAEINDVSVVDCTDVAYIGNVQEYEDVQQSSEFGKHKAISENASESSPLACDETREHDTSDLKQKVNRDVDALTQQNTSMSASASTESNENFTTATTSTKENYETSTELEQPLKKIIPSVITTVTDKAKLVDTPKVISYAEIAKKSKVALSIPHLASNNKSVLVANSIVTTATKENSSGIAKESIENAATNLSNHSKGSTSRFVPSLGGVIEVTPPKRQKSEDSSGFRSVRTRREIAALTVDQYVLVLTSSSIKVNGNEGILNRQVKALSFMELNEIRFRVLDATDTLHQNECTGLYMLSRLSNVYPQFFHVDTSGIPAYFGTIDQIENMIEDGSFIQRFSDHCKVVNVDGMSAPRGENLSGDVVSTSHFIQSKDEGKVQVTESGSGSFINIETTTPEGVSDTAEGTSKVTPSESKKHGEKKKVVRDRSKVSASADVMISEAKPKEQVKSEITVYGATSFVAKHAFDYFMQVSLSLQGDRTITLAGRSKAKLLELQSLLTGKMANLTMLTKKPIGKCLFDVFVADSTDIAALTNMARRTQLVANFAGPFTKYGEHVLAACAKCGTDYIDITGEISWAGQMRQRYSGIAEASGARIISLCGFDSIPSDLAIFGAVDALRRARRSNVEIEAGTCWHSSAGMANGGTIHSALGIPLNLRYCFSQPVPFLLDDPLVLTHPRTRFDPNSQGTKNRMAKVEWLNQLPSFDSILVLGASAPFFMAPVNSKVVQATAIALNYGPYFTYRERFLPLGVASTRRMGLLSILPALMVQFGLFIVAAVLMTPFIGKLLADFFAPPGSGAPDYACKTGFAHVYAEVSTKSDAKGLVDKANCSMNFEGDPGNWVTAQCVCESALALILDKSKLPPRSKDGFGTPAELLGSVLLNRLQATKIRPVKMKTHVRKDVPHHETVVFL